MIPTEEAQKKEKEEKELVFVSLPFVPVYHVSKDGEITLHLEDPEKVKCQLKKRTK